MTKILKGLAVVTCFIVMTLSLTACNTVAGLGKDVQAGGKELSKAASK